MKVKAIELTASDGVILRGQYWAGGDDWIIFLHDVGEDLDCWQPLVQRVLQYGYSLLSLDLRGHGASEGEWQSGKADLDVAAALDYAQANNPKNLFVVAAGVSVIATLKAADSSHLKAGVFLSPGPLENHIDAQNLRGAGIAKLFVIGVHDVQIKETATALRNASIGWSLLVNLPTRENGIKLLTNRWGVHVQEHITSFFHEQRHFDERPKNAAPRSIDELLRHSDENNL